MTVVAMSNPAPALRKRFLLIPLSLKVNAFFVLSNAVAIKVALDIAKTGKIGSTYRHCLFAIMVKKT
jgi:hypothetical protein